jgi:hypothetical protein
MALPREHISALAHRRLAGCNDSVGYQRAIQHLSDQAKWTYGLTGEPQPLARVVRFSGSRPRYFITQLVGSQVACSLDDRRGQTVRGVLNQGVVFLAALSIACPVAEMSSPAPETV